LPVKYTITGDNLYSVLRDHGCHGSYELSKFQILSAHDLPNGFAVELQLISVGVCEGSKLDEEIARVGHSGCNKEDYPILGKIEKMTMQQFAKYADDNDEDEDDDVDKTVKESFLRFNLITKKEEYEYQVEVVSETASANVQTFLTHCHDHES
jgi:hypothetical protein